MAYKQELWQEAKKRCRLGDEEIRMAKEMGLNPKSLIKNVPGLRIEGHCLTVTGVCAECASKE